MANPVNLLMVDHDHNNASDVAALLEDLPVTIEVVTSSKAALSALGAMDALPALCIVDANMPQQDGYQLLNRLFSQERYLPLPVLLLIDNLSDAKQQLHQVIMSAVDVLSKPLSPAKLRDIVQCYVQLAEYRQALRAIDEQAKEDFWESASEGVIGVGPDGDIRFINAVASRLLCARPTELVGTYVESLFEEPNRAVASKWASHPITTMCAKGNALQVEKGEFWCADGKTITIKFAAIPMSHVDGIEIIIAFKTLKLDSDKQKKPNVSRQVDGLTGLPLRPQLKQQLTVLLNKASEHQRTCAVLMIDLDHFKNINQSLGFELGDQLLVALVQRIRSCLRRNDVLGRIGGDEFIVISSRLATPEDAGVVAQKIIGRISEAFLLGGHEIFTSASVGVATYPNCGDDADSLMKHAEVAATRAKGLGRNHYQFFTVGMNSQRLKRMQLEHDVRQALERDELTIEYQPMIAGHSLILAGFTAEVVWHHHSATLRGTELYQIIEDASVSQAFCRWLWDSAMATMAQAEFCDGQTQPSPWCGLPLIPAQLYSESFWVWVDEQLLHHRLQANNILLQLPESVILSRHREWEPVLKRLREKGFDLALADFGAGYAPLSLLKRIPLSIIQIGEGLLEAPLLDIDIAMLDSVISLAHRLGLKVWAHRIENAAQWQFLRDSGCDFLGGSLIAEPMNFELSETLDRFVDALNQQCARLDAR